jgi:hypothetical protein
MATSDLYVSHALARKRQRLVLDVENVKAQVREAVMGNVNARKAMWEFVVVTVIPTISR